MDRRTYSINKEYSRCPVLALSSPRLLRPSALPELFYPICVRVQTANVRLQMDSVRMETEHV